MRFKDKTVLITGASGGIGQVLVPAFLKEGANVVAVYCNSKPSFGFNFMHDLLLVQADLALEEGGKHVVRTCVEKYGTVDILINGAAITTDAFIEKMSFDQWQKVVAANLNFTFNVTKPAMAHMKLKNTGHIITISSIVAETGALGCSNYVAAKAGLIGFTSAVARETERYSVYANSLILGYFDAGLGALLSQPIREKIVEKIPLRRFGNPKDIVKAVFFLAETEYMSGGRLELTGGL